MKACTLVETESLVGSLAVDQPGYAEAIDHHAKKCNPERFLELHHNSAVSPLLVALRLLLREEEFCRPSESDQQPRGLTSAGHTHEARVLLRVADDDGAEPIIAGPGVP